MPPKKDYVPNSNRPGVEQTPLQTVGRALDVLLSFSEFRTEWGVQELAQDFGLSRSSAQRLLAALAEGGFLRSDPITRRYSLGPALWRTAQVWERAGGLGALVEPVLISLTISSQRTALFSVPDGAHIRCVQAVAGGSTPTRARHLINELTPAHAGAAPRAYFAFLDPVEREQVMTRRPRGRYSAQTRVEGSAINALLDETVAAGHARSEGEFDSATRALAVPVFLGRRPIGSVTLLESKRTQHRTSLLDHLDELLAASKAIANLITSPARAPRKRS